MKNMKRVKERVLMKKGKHRERQKSSAPISTDGGTVTTSPVAGLKRLSDKTSRRESAPIPLMTPAKTPEAWTTSKTNSAISYTISMPKSIIFGMEDGLKDREGVISITKDVQMFLATISELRQAMEEMDAHQITPKIRLLSDDEEEEVVDSEEEILDEKNEFPNENNDLVNKKLKTLVKVVEICLKANPGMQSTLLIDASKRLLTTYQECNHDNSKVSDCVNCTIAIDNLVDTFTKCVEDYMIGENIHVSMDIPPVNGNQSGTGSGSGLNIPNTTPSRQKQVNAPVKGNNLNTSKSYDNLALFGSNLDISQPHDPVVDEIDQTLFGVDNPIRVASNYIKLRQKYHRELVGYLSKRAQLEQKYYSQLGRAVKQTQSALSELESSHQGWSSSVNDLIRRSLENESRYAMHCNTTFNLQVSHKILEPLELQIQVCEKSRKNLINTWVRESKKVVESRTAMKNAKTKYEFLGQELIRLKNILGNEPVGPKAEKRKKEIADIETKWHESEEAYKTSVAHCNDCQYQVHETALKSILCALRRLIVGFDSALKKGLENYFQLQHNFFKSLPEPLLVDIENTKEYEIGSEFLDFLSKQPRTRDQLEDYHFEEFDPESDLWDTPEENGGGYPGGNKLTSELSRSSLNLTVDYKPTNERALSPTFEGGLGKVKGFLHRNDTPSPKQDIRKTRPKSMALLDNITLLSSPSESPKNTLQRRNSDKSKNLLSVSPPAVDDVIYSKMAKTHSLKKLRTPARCRGCDTYVYFHGFDCEICGLACHRKCLATLAIRCGNKKLPRKMNVFGIDFHEHLKATKRTIPIIVTKCINEIESRGLKTQGLYRISSAKSKMEKLCQLFESGSERVDLSDLPPHLISSCLKLYFRQLPEPLLTFDMYQEFLTFAREGSLILPCNFDKCTEERAEKAREVLERLQNLIKRLSDKSQATLARLMYHLNKVSSPEYVAVNCMPASNLGIVFGPNLLRQKEMVPSLALLANMSLQAKVVEIMVAHAHDIFDFSKEYLIRLEKDASEENEVLHNELSVDIISPTDEIPIEIKMDISDARTPSSTPPERRKQNVEELHEVLQDFTCGNLLSPSNYMLNRSKSEPPAATPPVVASPLLMDSRYWKECVEPNKANLPGCIEDFTESIMTSIEKKMIRPPHSSLEKVLTPVMEIKDDLQHDSDDSTEVEIIQVSVEKPFKTWSTHSLTKSSSTFFGEDNDSIADNDVFHSRTASNASSVNYDTSGLSVGGSRSEDNLLQHTNKYSDTKETTKPDNNMKKFAADFGIDDTQSTGSSDSLKYYPLESPNVLALLKTSTKARPVTLAHTYPRPHKPSFVPTRQMSESEFKHSKPLFSVGSPPFDSCVSLHSIGKSISIASSSQGSVSEGIVDDLTSPSDISLKKPLQLNNTKTDNDNEAHVGDDRKSLTDGGSANLKTSIVDDCSNNSNDIPLPDDSPTAVSSKLIKNHHKHSLSRDSGLSDSPDPFVDLTSPSHVINSLMLTDKLTQVSKNQLSPLVSRSQQVNRSPDCTKEFQDILKVANSVNRRRKPSNQQKDHGKQSKVLKITPSSVRSKSVTQLYPSIDAVDEQGHVQRLRMASPDDQGDKKLVFIMKRSLSHGEVLKCSDEMYEEEVNDNSDSETEAEVGNSSSSSKHCSLRTDERKVSKSLDDLLP